MLENIGKPKGDYRFVTGNDIDGFLDDLNTPKQETVRDRYDGLEDLPSDDIEVDEEKQEPVDIQMKASAAKATGKLVATVIDTTLPQALAFIAKDNGVENYRADESQREELEEALTEYMRLKGGDVPPGVMIVILVITIYGTKIPMAIQQRKLNERAAALDEREKMLQLRERELSLQAKQPQKENANE